MSLYEDFSDRAMLERHLAINLVGPYDVTQAVLPLLTLSHGAIVTMAEGWRGSAVKALERQLAAYVDSTPVKSLAL